MDDEDAIETWLDLIEKYAPLPSFSRGRIEKEIPIWIKSLDDVDTETTRKGKQLLKKWEALLPDLVQYSRFNYFNRPDWTDESHVKRVVKFLWVNTYHEVRVYIESKKVEDNAISRAIQVIGNPHSNTNLIQHISILYAGHSFSYDFVHIEPPSPTTLLESPPTLLEPSSPAPASLTEESFESVD
jgi:hypothetical protein